MSARHLLGGFGDAGSLSEGQLDTLDGITWSLSAISAACSFAVVASYWSYKDLRTHAFALVHYLALADLFNSLWPYLPQSPVASCSLQAFVYQLFSLASILWTVAIAHTLWATVVARDEDVARFMRWYHAGVWGTSGVSAIVPLAAGRYESVGPWCWIATAPTGDKGGVAMRFAFFYVPLWLVIAYQLGVYAQVMRTLSVLSRMHAAARGESRGARTRAWAIIRRLGYYPLILIFVYSFATVHRCINAATGRTVFWLYVLQAVFGALQGAMHAAAYGMNEDVRAHWRDSLGGLCCGRGGAHAHTRFEDEGEAGELAFDDTNVPGDIDDFNEAFASGKDNFKDGVEMVEVKLEESPR